MDDHISIGALARAVGIPGETLRTWERRYGVPKPVRTPTGHRRYGTDAREHLVRVRRLLDHGYKPSTVLPWSIAELDEHIASLEAPERPPEHAALGDAMQAVAASDASALERELERAWNSMTAEGFIEQFALPLLEHIGSAWAAGDIDVGQEHFASAIIESFLATRWRALARLNNGPVVLCAALPDEHHVLGLHLAAIELALAGARIGYLGADTPIETIVSSVERLEAVGIVMCISAAARNAEPQLHFLLRELDSNGVQARLLVGGSGALQLGARVQGSERLTLTQNLTEVHPWARKLVA